MSIWAEITVILILILLNGFFAMSELAIVSARRGRLKTEAEAGHKGADLALRLADDPSSFLSVVQVGMTFINVILGAYSGATIAARFGDPLNQISWINPHGESVSFVLTIVTATFLNIVIGELVPKRFGLSYPEPIAMRVAFTMLCIAKATAPVVWGLKHSTEILLRLLGLNAGRNAAVTEDEVKDMIAEGAESGVLKPEEKSMLEGVMRLADRTVRTIMTPRVDMIWLGIEDGADVNKDAIRTSGYSRFPVGRGDLEEILGIASAKDILNAGFDGKPFSLSSILRPALVVPDSTTVLRLLDQFKHAGQHIAIVVDEYGSVEGLVTVTDILEAIMGTLPETGQDSLDKPVQREDGSWLIDGMTPIDEVETLIGLKRMRGDGDFHTLAGFMIDQLGRLPTAGDHTLWHNARFEVVDMDGRRIDKVLVTPPAMDEVDGD